MPILLVVKRSRPRLLPALERHLEKPGLVMILLDRRRGRERRRRPAALIGLEDRRLLSRRQPLDMNAARAWAELGVLFRKVRTLPDASPRSQPRARPTARPRRPRRRTAVRRHSR